MGNLNRSFDRLGFPVEVNSDQEQVRGIGGAPYVVTVTRDKKGKEKFIIDMEKGIEATVLNVAANYQALLLMVRDDGLGGKDLNPVKMLLGHDERQLFVAAVPDNSTSVEGAMEALKPEAVVAAEKRSGVKRKRRHRRRNKGRIRQGDFFFIPVPDLDVPEEFILKKEPINRGRGAAHTVEFLYRTGGEDVYICGRYPNGVAPRTYQRFIDSNPKARFWGWQFMKRNPEVYAKGRVTHHEHATIILEVWHRVFPNTEASFGSFQQMAFID